jgi:hypothetical protein
MGPERKMPLAVASQDIAGKLDKSRAGGVIQRGSGDEVSVGIQADLFFSKPFVCNFAILGAPIVMPIGCHMELEAQGQGQSNLASEQPHRA